MPPIRLPSLNLKPWRPSFLIEHRGSSLRGPRYGPRRRTGWLKVLTSRSDRIHRYADPGLGRGTRRRPVPISFGQRQHLHLEQFCQSPRAIFFDVKILAHFSPPEALTLRVSRSRPRFSKRQLEAKAQWRSRTSIPGSPAVYRAGVAATDIVQDVVTDCSVVAALAAAVHHNAKFGTKVFMPCTFALNQGADFEVEARGVGITSNRDRWAANIKQRRPTSR